MAIFRRMLFFSVCCVLLCVLGAFIPRVSAVHVKTCDCYLSCSTHGLRLIPYCMGNVCFYMNQTFEDEEPESDREKLLQMLTAIGEIAHQEPDPNFDKLCAKYNGDGKCPYTADQVGFLPADQVGFLPADQVGFLPADKVESGLQQHVY